MLTSNFCQIQISKILNYRYCLWMLWLAGTVCEYFAPNSIFLLEVKTWVFFYFFFIFWGKNMSVLLFSNGTLDSDWIHMPSRGWRQIESRLQSIDWVLYHSLPCIKYKNLFVVIQWTLGVDLHICTDECSGFWWGQRFKTKE